MTNTALAACCNTQLTYTDTSLHPHKIFSVREKTFIMTKHTMPMFCSILPSSRDQNYITKQLSLKKISILHFIFTV